MDRLYRYYGTVSSLNYIGTYHLLTLRRWSPHDAYDRVPPVLIRCPHNGLFKYINDLTCTDDEEKYLEAVYCYDDNFCLRAIEYYAQSEYRSESLCKVIATPDTIGEEDEVEIFGNPLHITTSRPSPMSREELSRWYDYRYEHHLF